MYSCEIHIHVCVYIYVHTCEYTRMCVFIINGKVTSFEHIMMSKQGGVRITSETLQTRTWGSNEFRLRRGMCGAGGGV